jgi:hypothetical protein
LPLGKLQSIVVHEPWEIVGVDIIGALKKTIKRNQYIIVFTCHLTKWVEAFAIHDS